MLLDGVKQSPHHRIGIPPADQLDRRRGNAESRQHCGGERRAHHGARARGGADVGVARVVLAVQVVRETEVVEEVDVSHVAERVAVGSRVRGGWRGVVGKKEWVSDWVKKVGDCASDTTRDEKKP